MKKNAIAVHLACTALIFSMLACGGASTPAASGDAVSSMVASTLQALTPLASATLPPTAAPPPTAASTTAPSPAPTSSNLPVATRLNFAAGATQTVVQGSIQSAQTLHYVVRASKDQPMIVMVDSPDHEVTLSVFGANGTELLPAAQQDSSWQGLLPTTQDYYFRLTGAGSTQNFSLNVVIAARILFDAGQDQVTLSGRTVGGYSVAYAAYALGGQEMEVTINTEPDDAALTIWGFSDGQPYARAQNGVTEFSMTLPSTQDYIIQVVPQGGQVLDYTLTVEIQ
jgi:hypothetical protein